MKLILRTDLWGEKDPKVWREKYEKLAFATGLMAAANIIVGVWTENTALIVINAFPLFLGITATFSYTRWNKNERERKEKRKRS